jgi:hypothetical protein
VGNVNVTNFPRLGKSMFGVCGVVNSRKKFVLMVRWDLLDGSLNWAAGIVDRPQVRQQDRGRGINLGCFTPTFSVNVIVSVID